jgi:hypothetical protein
VLSQEPGELGTTEHITELGQQLVARVERDQVISSGVEHLARGAIPDALALQMKFLQSRGHIGGKIAQLAELLCHLFHVVLARILLVRFIIGTVQGDGYIRYYMLRMSSERDDHGTL